MANLQRKKNDTARRDRRRVEDIARRDNRIKNDDLTRERRDKADRTMYENRSRNDEMTTHRREINDGNFGMKLAIFLLVLAVLAFGAYIILSKGSL